MLKTFRKILILSTFLLFVSCYNDVSPFWYLEKYNTINHRRNARNFTCRWFNRGRLHFCPILNWQNLKLMSRILAGIELTGLLLQAPILVQEHLIFGIVKLMAIQDGRIVTHLEEIVFLLSGNSK